MTFEETGTASGTGGHLPPVRVLVIDDDEEDFLIVRDLLADAGRTRYVVEWAADPEAALARLEGAGAAPACDVCLLDYRLGRHDGLELLREIAARGYRVPVVLLTGQDDSDVDEEAMRGGASDYLVKGRIDSVLLERSIRYALRHQRDADELRRQNDFVSAVVDTAGALVVVLDRHGRVTRFNRACEQATGFTFAELRGEVFWDRLIPAEEAPSIRAVFGDLIAGQFPNEHENDWLTKGGGRRRIAWSNTALLDARGAVEYVIGTGIDVTERRQAEAALAQARRREIEHGAGIQRTLLLRMPSLQLPGLSFGAAFRTSQQVGGDFFDLFSYGDRCVDVLIGDVMGKGVPAALLAAATKAHFQRAVRRLMLQAEPFGRLPEPEEVVTAVHSLITPELFGLNSFVTLSYARFDLDRGDVTLVDCGHPRPLRVHGEAGTAPGSAREVEVLSGENLPLGMSERETYRQARFAVAPGDLFLFYSDGVTDATDGSDEPFGEERLQDALASLRGLPPQEVAERLCAAVEGYGASRPCGDDYTCVAVRVEAGVAPRRRGFRALEIASDPGRLEDARYFLEDFCLDHAPALDEDARERLVLAANEGIGNVLRHAYSGRTDGRVQIEAEAFEGSVRVRIHDAGEPFVGRAAVPPPSFDGSRDNGFGMYLIRECVDQAEYSRDDMGRNTLTLVKRYPAPSDRAGRKEQGAIV